VRIIVQKYGGSSVATVEKIQAIAERVVATRRQGFAVVVVVSAMGNTTNELLALARQVSTDPPRRELDMLLSVGERISMALLSTAIAALGENAISFTGSQVGILTNDHHFAARIIDVRPFRIQDELARDKIVIVAGYQGTSYRREITTLGRGGSDTTAVALAAALSAEACDIYSDVPGVWSADPRVVESAQRLDEISYEEMQELARQGARVLNAQAVEFARRRQIAIYARSTFDQSGHTVIRRVDGMLEDAAASEAGFGVHGVAGSRHRLHVTLDLVAGDMDEELAVMKLVEHTSVAFAHRTTTTLELLLATENEADPGGLVAAIQEVAGGRVTVRQSVGTASAVGLGAGTWPAVIPFALRALAGTHIVPVAIHLSRDAVIAVVSLEQVEDACRALHRAFIEIPAQQARQALQVNHSEP
jgi:aspartate kinase